MADFEPTIGLEVHAELKTKTKMFCACRNDPSEQHPNVNICPICMGHPGTLPVPNKEAVRLVQLVGAAFDCELAEFSKFDRKNYFYPDLPKGYQISQYDLPFCRSGTLTLSNGTAVRIHRIHLEEDTGRLSHPEGKDYSVVDFNRAGVPLMELVTEPDLSSAEDVELFARELKQILRYVGASDANMEKGEMRVEVNISLREMRGNTSFDGAQDKQNAPRKHAEEGEEKLGTKVEVKNLNSIRSARMAVAYEIDRQSKLLQESKEVAQETRGWHDDRQETFSQRTKEEAHDYRYFPEPDIPPLRFTQDELVRIRAEVPELPQARRERFAKEYGPSGEEIETMVADRAMGDYFEKSASELKAWLKAEGAEMSSEKTIGLAANYLLSDVRGILQEHASSIDDIETITPENFAELITLVAKKEITSRTAKDVLRKMYETGGDPSDIIEREGLRQVSDEGEIEKVVKQVIEENEEAVEDYRGGKEAALKFLVGKVMAATKGKANPQVAEKLLQKQL